jgi:thiosulfate dehydrogenase [quinone] large subunit
MNALKSLTDRRLTGIVWLVVRLFIGYEFLTAGIEKLQSGAWIGPTAPAGIHGFLAGVLAKVGGAHPAVYDWYGSFIKSVAIPNEQLFGYLVCAGEILVGAALIVGIFTKWAAFWGAVMNLAFILAGSTSSNGYMVVAEVAMVFAGLGVSFYGLDTFVLPYLRKLLATWLHTTHQPTPQTKDGPLAAPLGA